MQVNAESDNIFFILYLRKYNATPVSVVPVLKIPYDLYFVHPDNCHLFHVDSIPLETK